MITAVWSAGVAALLLSLLAGCYGTYIDDVISKPNEFGYSEHNGPDTWPQTFRSCGGDHQSPIDISDEECLVDVELEPLSWVGQWRPKHDFEIRNTFHSVEVTCPVSEDRPQLSGGPLDGDYVLSQIHFHWGTGRGDGSEHALNHRHYGMEVHLVHYKTEYGTIGRASQKQDGLAVVALFFKSTRHRNNTELTSLVHALHDVIEGGSNSTLPEHAMGWMHKYLDTEEYYTYQGSLTTPPCTENVTWIILKRLASIGDKQIEEFRRLRGHDHHEMEENTRPVQPLYSRSVLYHQPQHLDVYFPD